MKKETLEVIKATLLISTVIALFVLGIIGLVFVTIFYYNELNLGVRIVLISSITILLAAVSATFHKLWTRR